MCLKGPIPEKERIQIFLGRGASRSMAMSAMRVLPDIRVKWRFARYRFRCCSPGARFQRLGRQLPQTPTSLSLTPVSVPLSDPTPQERLAVGYVSSGGNAGWPISKDRGPRRGRRWSSGKTPFVCLATQLIDTLDTAAAHGPVAIAQARRIAWTGRYTDRWDRF